MPRMEYRSDTSDTPTSSSENESIQSGPSSSIPSTTQPRHHEGLPDEEELSDPESEPTKWAEYEPPVIPHKVLKLRRLVYEALHCALTIIYDTQKHEIPLVPATAGKGRPSRKGQPGSEVVSLDVKEPWMRLSRVVVALRNAIISLKEEDRPCTGCLAALEIIVIGQILPLAENKAYVRSLARNEAKAIPSLLKAWDKIASASILTSVEEDEAIGIANHLSITIDTAPIILLRLAYHALLSNPLDPLDLSNLGIKTGIMDGLDISRLAEGMGINVGEIKEVNMSQNGWKRIPNWSPFPFPGTTTLDLTSNPNLSYLPLSLLRTAITKIHCRGTQLLNPDLPLVRSIPRFITNRRTNGRGSPTLLSILLKLYTTLIRPHYPLSALEGLPPRLAELISGTYACELCNQIVAASDLGNRWMEGEVERGWAVEGRNVLRQMGHGGVKERWVATKVVKVRGRVCEDCADRYLRPLPVEYG